MALDSLFLTLDSITCEQYYNVSPKLVAQSTEK